jgi:hypothetical protein
MAIAIGKEVRSPNLLEFTNAKNFNSSLTKEINGK